jgi:hypothetical protein
MQSNTLIPDTYQGAYPFSSDTLSTKSDPLATAPHGADSRALSLAPSDSASQQRLGIDLATDQAIEDILGRVEAPSMHPQVLPMSVLWYYDDCDKDPSGVIITEANKHRPRMNIAIRRPDVAG